MCANKLELTGQKFNKLTVIKEHGRSKERFTTWECRCECGNTTVVRGSHLKRGAIKSCGCSKASHALDLAGKRFGKLLAIRKCGQEKWGFYLWECLCDCGNFTIVRGSKLKSGHTKSCGCSHTRRDNTHRQKGLNSNFYVVLGEYRRGSYRRGIEWSLSDEQVLGLFGGDCFYCGEKPSGVRDTWGEKPFIFNGIDRLDSSQGYTKDNCVSCCSCCNWKKNDMPYQDFVQWVEQVYCNLKAKAVI